MTDDCLIPSASSPQGEKILIEVNSWRPPSLHICSHLTAGYRLSSMVEGFGTACGAYFLATTAAS